MNNNMKDGNSSALLGGISAIFLSIVTIEMVILKCGSWFLWVAFGLIIFANAKAVKITMGQVKTKSKKTKVLLGIASLVCALLVFGVISYIR